MNEIKEYKITYDDHTFRIKEIEIRGYFFNEPVFLKGQEDKWYSEWKASYRLNILPHLRPLTILKSKNKCIIMTIFYRIIFFTTKEERAQLKRAYYFSNNLMSFTVVCQNIKETFSKPYNKLIEILMQLFEKSQVYGILLDSFLIRAMTAKKIAHPKLRADIKIYTLFSDLETQIEY